MAVEISTLVFSLLLFPLGFAAYRLIKFFFPGNPFTFVGGNDALKDLTYDSSHPVPHGKKLTGPLFLEWWATVLIRNTGRHVGQIATDFHRKYGSIFKLNFLGTPQINIADADLAKKVMITSVDNFAKLDIATFPQHHAKAFLGGSSVLFSDGNEWQSQRKVMNPIFTTVDRFLPIFHDFVEKAISKISVRGVPAAQGGSIIEPAALMHQLTLDVLGRSVLQHEFNSLEGGTSRELQGYMYVMANLVAPLQALLPHWYLIPTKHNTKMNKSVQDVDSMILDLIEKSKKKVARIEETHQTEEMSLLDLLVASGEFNDDLLRNNAIVFFLAGHETTANALSFALCCLAKWPAVQEKLLAAIRQDIGDDINNIEKLNGCSYLDWFIKEVLRMYPPVSRVPARRVVKDSVIGGYKVPAGTMVGINTDAIHHNEKYWQQPYEFRPERFSPEESKGRPSGAYLPFGLGKRLCIGQQFSLLEQKTFLANFVQRYQVHLVVGHEEIAVQKGNAIMELVPEHKVRLTKRM